jgi:hypothetical protein
MLLAFHCPGARFMRGWNGRIEALLARRRTERLESLTDI